MLAKNNKFSSSKHNSKDVLEFTQIMDQLLASGLSMKDSLEIFSLLDSGHKKSKNIGSLLYSKIQKGISFADAVNSFPELFPPIYRGIISVGNKVGSVEKIFPRLKTYLETQKKLKDKFMGALIYPVMVLFTAAAAFVAMIFFVFPKLKEMFNDFGGDAALKLEQNINHMEFILSCILIILIFLAAAFLIIKRISKANENLKFLIDSTALNMPLLGKFLLYKETLNFSFAMETLTAGGINIEDALSESESVVSNQKYKKALQKIRNQVIKGEALSQAFENQHIFPQYLNKWIYVGERSGKPEQVFAQIRNYFQNEIDLYTSKFMSLIEPALIVLIGLFLIILVVTIIVPVFSLYGSIL